jgi:hypothetical protein
MRHTLKPSRSNRQARAGEQRKIKVPIHPSCNYCPRCARVYNGFVAIHIFVPLESMQVITSMPHIKGYNFCCVCVHCTDVRIPQTQHL